MNIFKFSGKIFDIYRRSKDIAGFHNLKGRRGTCQLRLSRFLNALSETVLLTSFVIETKEKPNVKYNVALDGFLLQFSAIRC